MSMTPDEALGRAEREARTLRKWLERFPSLPDQAVVPTKVTSAITSLSERTIRYHPALPRRWISRGRYGQGVGDIRKLVGGRVVGGQHLNVTRSGQDAAVHRGRASN